MHNFKTAWCFFLILVTAGVGLAADQDLAEPLFLFVDEPPGPTAPAIPDRTTTVTNWSRSSVASFFASDYTAPLSVAMGWTGSVATCTEGTTSQAYINATMQIISYYRNMVGLGDAFNAVSYNANAQRAALMMSANGALSHSPPPSWTCYSSGGASAAGSSNLALGNAGPAAMVAYIRDSGTYNYFVGHRRWMLYPLLNQFGTGSVGGSALNANALVVFTTFGSRPANPDKVAWPPEGYVPYQVVYPRWSFSLNTSSPVSFASANVSMTENGNPITLSVVSRTDNGYGDNTIVWEPSGLSFYPGMQDRRFRVTVRNISGPQSVVTYDVVVMDPATSAGAIFTDGFESGSTSLWSSTLN